MWRHRRVNCDSTEVYGGLNIYLCLVCFFYTIIITNCFSTSVIGKMRGLLTGIFDVSKAKDESRTMNVDLAVDLLEDMNQRVSVGQKYLEATRKSRQERKQKES